MNRHWKFVRYKCDLPKVDGWYFVIDAEGMEYKDWFYADKNKFSINTKIKAWAECV